MRYLDLGAGEPLLLLHGYPQNHRIPNVSLTCLPEAGHFVMEESPEPVLAALSGWLARPVSQTASQ